jgi:hypothetical protein
MTEKNIITKEEVIEAENQLFSAQFNSNVALLDRLIHDDLMAMSPTGEILTKEMDLNSHRAKTVILEEASTEIEKIKITADTALTIVTMTAKGKIMETPIEGKFRYFRVWQRLEGDLKLIGASYRQLT